jgi:tetratricopeptide (TPR) repeat protein
VKYDLDHATSYLALGWYAYRCSDYEEAIVASRIALELDPTLAAAAFNLGLFHLAKHELDEARLMYNRAVAICEKMPQVDVELLLKSALEDIEELATNNQALALEAGELIKKLSKTSSVVVQQIRYTWPASKICI